MNAAASVFTTVGPWAALRADERFARAFGDGPSGDDRNSSTHTNLDRASALHGSNAPSAPTPLLETALISTVSVAVLVRCALGDWSGAEARIADLLDGGSWEAVAETELGLRDLVRLPGADTERLEAIHSGLIATCG